MAKILTVRLVPKLGRESPKVLTVILDNLSHVEYRKGEGVGFFVKRGTGEPATLAFYQGQIGSAGVDAIHEAAQGLLRMSPPCEKTVSVDWLL